MDRRVLLAIGLMLIVMVLPQILFPPPERVPRARRFPPADSATLPGADTVVVAPSPATETGAAAQVTESPVAAGPADSVPEQLVVVESQLYRYVFSSRGMRLVSATLKHYESFAAGDAGAVQLMPESSRFLEYALVFGYDTLSLGEWVFEPSDTHLVVEAQEAELQWAARRGAATIQVTQRFQPGRYVFDVAGMFAGTSETAGLALVRLGPRFRTIEADSAWDYRSYAVVSKARSAERTSFSSLDPGEPAVLAGPFEWVALKSRYFLCAVLTIDEGAPRIGGALATGGPRSGRYATHADVVMSLPAPGGEFRHSVYVGPQEVRRLSRVGHDLKDINPYGWFLRPIIQPIANIVAQILVWMHEALNLAYGWVLVVFGVAVRIVLWPLFKKQMRSSMAMQALQPEIKAVQQRYKQDPQRLQQEMMKLYREHKVNPLSGCLPMLLPMPVLFALFFVFRETIEFRGVPFLWLPDLSAADPLYIVPIIMGLSMFGTMKLGQLGIPPNPQSKMMVYFMPIMFVVLFMRFSSGLNLYYAVSNIASIPQQWLIARERMRKAAKPGKKKTERV